MLAAPVLAHQGGWDEILMVLAPLALFVVLLRAANRRHRAHVEPVEPVEPGEPVHPDRRSDPRDGRA